MSYDITERIDDMCREKYGHAHWVCLDTLRDQEKVGLDEVAEIITIKGQQVAFYFDDTRSEAGGGN
tara:strand:- start:269 stop:466 length:198 start_codon:yes stop_codon:yes gene_type:complete